MIKHAAIIMALSAILLANMPSWAQHVQQPGKIQQGMPAMQPQQKAEMMADMKKHHQMMMEEGQMVQQMGAMMQKQGQMMMDHAQMMQNCPMTQQMMQPPVK